MVYGIRTCFICGKEIEITKWGRINQERVFCSNACVAKANKKIRVPNCKCIVCGKEYWRQPSHFNRYNSKYCSRKCQYKDKETYMRGAGNHQYGLKGSKNASWHSDERISGYGYRLIRVLDHPFRNCDDMVFEHRLIAEKYLLTEENSIEVNGKRYLKKGYEVHHKDMNKLNNDVSNLVVLTKAQHRSLHNKLTVAEKGVAQSHRKQIESPEEIKQITEEFLRSIA